MPGVRSNGHEWGRGCCHKSFAALWGKLRRLAFLLGVLSLEDPPVLFSMTKYLANFFHHQLNSTLSVLLTLSLKISLMIIDIVFLIFYR